MKFPAAFFALSLTAGAAQAFDGRRQGFFLGGGAGGSLTFHQPEREFEGTMRGSWESSGGAATHLALGYAFTNRWALQYFSDVNWFHYEPTEAIVSTGNAGLQLTHYFKDGGETFAASPYVYGGLGWAGWTAPFEDPDGSSALFGAGFSLGGGYEFARYWSVRLGTFFTKPSEKAGSQAFSFRVRGIHVQVVGLAY